METEKGLSYITGSSLIFVTVTMRLHFTLLNTEHGEGMLEVN